MKRKKSTIILSLGLALFLTLGFFAKGEKPPHAGKLASEPIWQITKSGTDEAVNWEDYAPNPRFAIYHSGTPADETDDVVLDKETGLVWERCPGLEGEMTFYIAEHYCYDRYLAGRKGWRLPTIEELTSLVIPGNPGSLPFGHPFIPTIAGNCYWSCTTTSDATIRVYDIGLHDGGVSGHERYLTRLVWCVRGGQGHNAY